MAIRPGHSRDVHATRSGSGAGDATYIDNSIEKSDGGLKGLATSITPANIITLVMIVIGLVVAWVRLEEAQKTMFSAIERTTSEVNSVREDLAKLKSDMSSMKEELIGIGGKVGTLQTSFEKQEEILEKNGERIQKLELDIATHTSRPNHEK